MNNINGPLKVGIGGGIGTGKTSLTEALCRYLSKKVSMAVISNDIYTTEDAEYLMKAQVLPIERIKGCLLYTSPSPRDSCASRMPSSA